MHSSYLWLIPALPLCGAMINGTLALASSKNSAAPSHGMASFVAVSSVCAAFFVTLMACFDLQDAPSHALTQHLWQWFSVSTFDVSMSLLFDHLSSFMLLFITFIGAMIHIYSVGYMKTDRSYARFMAYMNLFMFSIIMLVMGGNLLVSFLGWEGVGLCSYLLIGFWHHDHANNDAARKAFITNRVGDVGFLIGAFLLFYAMSVTTGTGDSSIAPSFDYTNISAWAQTLVASTDTSLLALISAACFFIFWACTAKSAQIPLLTWLPDAMAGPTPVSALIHAATMVTAGIFMVCRLGDVFLLAPDIMSMITIIGIATALYAAIAAMFQWDIKKVLAYSTVSQLGFMFMAVGVGAFDVALFHVLTHAFFKATLFLGAGSVIHAVHHQQDMRKMGGLAPSLPITRTSMLFAWFAICGFPLASGFMSKDLILERLAFFGGGSWVLYAAAILAAVLTAFYMTRLLILTFYSNDRVDPAVKKDIREVPMVMWAPVLLLAIGSLAIGLMWCDAALVWALAVFPVGDMQITDFTNMRLLPEYLHHALPQAHLYSVAHADHGLLPLILGAIGVSAAIIGAFVAKMRFGKGLSEKDSEVSEMSGFGLVWARIFDTAYDICVCKPVVFISASLNRFVDQLCIQRSLQAISVAVSAVGDACRMAQRGRLRISLMMSLFAVIVLFIVVIFGSIGWGV